MIKRGSEIKYDDLKGQVYVYFSETQVRVYKNDLLDMFNEFQNQSYELTYMNNCTYVNTVYDNE